MLNVGIIICTKDRPNELNHALESISGQSYLPKEVIIVDSSNNVESIADSDFFKLNIKRYFTKPSLVKQRNFGIRQISYDTDIILFLDDDVELESDYLFNIAKAFEDDELIIGATGYIKNLPRKSAFTLRRKNGYVDKAARNFFADNINGNSELMWLSGCNMAYRSSIFKDQLFDEFFEEYGLGEDLEFSFRVGQFGKLLFMPEAKLLHFESPVARISLRRLGFMYVTNKAHIVNKYPDYFSKTAFITLVVTKAIQYFAYGFVLGNDDKKQLFYGYLDSIKTKLLR